MDAPTSQPCLSCEALRAELAEFRQRLAALEAELAKARKNSSNSSKPPSSDIVKPKPAQPSSGQRRKRGGQPGHPRHERTAFPPEQVDERIHYAVAECPDCRCGTVPLDQPAQVIQQIEIVAKPFQISEHVGQGTVCPCCRRTFQGAIPREVKAAGLAGPRLTAIVAYLKGACHCSFSTIRKFLRDVLGVTLSRSYLRNLCGEVSDGLAAAYEELYRALPRQPLLNVDETGHKELGERLWTWCFRAPLFTLFKIDPSRGSDVLLAALGEEFAGVLGCDYFSAYRKYMKGCNVLVQFCLAHLLRDIRFLVQHPHPANQAYGQRVLEAARALFRVIHCRDLYPPQAFPIVLQSAGNELRAQALDAVPGQREARNLANRFRKHGDSYLRFITTPGIDPTNNLAEQAIRFVVIDRLVTQGTRGEAGRRWSERIWTVLATCVQQGRPPFRFLAETIAAHLAGAPTPSLLPNSS